MWAEVNGVGNFCLCGLESLREASVLGGSWELGGLRSPSWLGHLCSAQFHSVGRQPGLLDAAVLAFQGGPEQKVQDLLWPRLGNCATLSSPTFYWSKPAPRPPSWKGWGNRFHPLDGHKLQGTNGSVLFLVSHIKKSIQLYPFLYRCLVFCLYLLAMLVQQDGSESLFQKRFQLSWGSCSLITAFVVVKVRHMKPSWKLCRQYLV